MKKVKFAFLLITALLVAHETISQTVITYGETIIGAISVDGEIDTYMFSGKAGDKVIIRMTESIAGSSEILEPYVELYNPTGELIKDSSDGSQVKIFMQLPTTGTYTLLASDSYPGDDVGNYAIFIQRAFDPGLADTLQYGETAAASISPGGNIDTYLFSGNAGDKVIIRMTESIAGSSEILEPYVELYNPTGELIKDSSDGSQVKISMQLPTTGTYTLLASDSYPGDDAGNYAIFIQRAFDPGLADTLQYGETAAASISPGGNIDTYLFSGNAGDKVIIRMTESIAGSSEILEPYVELYNPTGELIKDSSDVSQVNITYNLINSGYYTILASDYYPGDDAGDYAIYLFGFEGPGPETDILSYSFGIPPQTKEADIDLSSHTIAVEVEYGTNVADLIAFFTLSEGATASINEVNQQSGMTVNDFTYPVVYKITAEDDTTIQDWIVNVAILPNNETDITSFSFGIPPQTREAIVDQVSHTVTLEVENGTDVTELIAIFELSEGATANVGGLDQQSGVTANDFTSPVTYKITAEDGTTIQYWIVIIEIATVLPEEYVQNIKIYPNPFSYKTTIEFNNSDQINYKLTISNLSGNRFYEVDNITSNKVELLKSDLKPGIYLIEIIGTEIYRDKLIIE
jgi:hypothetical protein